MELSKSPEDLLTRRLTATQRHSLAEVLSSGEKGKIVIRFLSGNIECQNFAMDVADVFQSCGWTLMQMGAALAIGTTGSVGLRVTLQDPKMPQAVALLTAFEHIGISMPVTINPNAHPPVYLIIGGKP